MKAGFARTVITPPHGTRMTGWLDRDRERGCDAVHDDLYARALYLSHGDQESLIIGFDLLFFSRNEADRFKGAIGRKLNLPPSHVLLNTSHTHDGPKVGEWGYDPPSDPTYLHQLENAIVAVACQSRDNAVDVTIQAGMARTSVPLSRRRKQADGTIAFAPNPAGPVCDLLPMCLLSDAYSRPVCLLFSVSCHPSTISGFAISADYPGVAMELLDRHLGGTASMFLQGAAGDSKVSIIGKGLDRWRKATWDDVTESGQTVAREVITLLDAGLQPVQPDLHCASVEMEWAFEPDIGYSGFKAVVAKPDTDQTTRLWAQDMLNQLDRGYRIPSTVPITLQGIKLGEGLRLVGLEGEPVAELGLHMARYYNRGITFPLGYTNGAQLYLPTTAMLDEGGYEVTSYAEYRQPARLAKGMEHKITAALQQLQQAGID